MKSIKLEVYKNVNNKWHGRVRHTNGKIVLVTSEGGGYSRKTDCVSMLRRYVRDGRLLDILEVEE